MANPEHVALVKRGAKAIDRWRSEHPNQRLDLTEADLRGADLSYADLSGVDLSTAKLFAADLSSADLIGTDLSKADLSDANLREADLSDANLSGALLDRAKLFMTNLGGADLSQVNLRAAELFWADLSGANLREANLDSANLVVAQLGGVDLSGADLTEANLLGPNMSEADLSRADLSSANLIGAELSRVELSEGTCGLTKLADCDLSRACGLETVRHSYPSSIGVDTLVRTLERTGGQFTAAQRTFFTGAGVPETLLDYLPALMESQPIQFFSCFISYGTPDGAFADRLYNDLRRKGLRCWKYDEDALVGRGVWANIDRAIALHNKAIVICSQRSLQRPGVQREIERALQREDELRRRQAEAPDRDIDTDVLVPIRLDDYVLSEWEHPRRADVIAKHIGDFCGWDKGKTAYKRGLEQLLRALDPRSKLGLSGPTRITAKS